MNKCVQYHLLRKRKQDYYFLLVHSFFSCNVYNKCVDNVILIRINRKKTITQNFLMVQCHQGRLLC